MQRVSSAPPLSSTRDVVRLVGLGLSLGLLVLVAALAGLLVVVPKATGAEPLTVLTGSMAPSLPPGTLVIVRPVDPERIRIGQVVTYQIASGRPDVVTHRVVGITTASDGTRVFAFRGDANTAPDAQAVRPVQIRGVLWYSVPGVGWANDLVNGPARAWVVPSAAGALFVYAAVMIGSGAAAAVRRRPRRRACRPHYRRAVDGMHARPTANPPRRRRRGHVHLTE